MKKSIIMMFICILGSVISMIAYFISEKYSENVSSTIVTLSSEQLAGVGYTEATTFDDRDLWESGDYTYAYSNAKSETETVSVVVFPIDINIASAEELINIKGIGEVTAESIVSYRNEHGYFHSIEELLNIDGIGEKTLDKMREYIFIAPDIAEEITETAAETVTENSISANTADIFPIELNTATAEELMQINGVGEVTADAIVEYAQTVGFKKVSDLMNINGIGEKKFENIKPYVYVDGEVND